MSHPRPSHLGRGRYELHDPVGSGGMATVFRATDRQRNRMCAVKLLTPHAARSPKVRRRFLTEVATMKALDHPNVVRVLDVGPDGDHIYFVMELATGGSVADYLRHHGPRGPREALALMFQVLQGLDYAHTAGVVHRDIKPHNMLLLHEPDPLSDPDDELSRQRQLVKLTDFGIAKHMVMGRGGRITGTGDTLGTLAYMAPEQRIDPRHAHVQSDIYGVGATIYIMITGRRPFDIAMEAAKPEALRRLPEEVRDIVERATQPEPDGRYATARDMAHALADAWCNLSAEPAGATDLVMDAFELDGDTIVAPHSPDHDDDSDAPLT